MSTTPPNAAGLADYKRVMVTRFGSTCQWCGAGTGPQTGDFAALGHDGKWIASCIVCSVSMSAMILGVCKRIGAVQDTLTPEQEATLAMPADLLDAIDGNLTHKEMVLVLADVVATWKSVETFTTTATAVTAVNTLLTGRVYTVNGVHYRIKESKTGNQYALRFINNGEGRKGSWEYDRGAIMTVRRSGTLMTAADAAALGHSTHHCVFCSLELTDERSTIVGYGPICAGKHGLPWG